MYITRFVRIDGKTEDHYYNSIADARYHLNLFRDDDSGLYDRIEIREANDNVNFPVQAFVF